jgi:ribose transport system permease protein
MTQPLPPTDEAQALEEPVEERRGPWWQALVAGSSTWIGLILVALIVVFSLINPTDFFSASNARNIATDAAVLLILATGMTYVIITAGIDLSVGSVLVFSGVVSAKLMNSIGGNGTGVIVVGLLISLLAGCAWGLINGFLVTKARIPSFIVTLGTFGIALGAALLITGGVDEREVPVNLITGIGTGRLFGQIPWLVVIAAGVCLVYGVILAQTRFGRYTYATGSNAEGVRRSGVSVDAHLIKVYTLMGTLAGLAGFLSLARFGTTTISGHTTDNLNVIAAVVIGGTSLFGGVGTILGTVFGVFIPVVLQNGFVIIGIQPFWQQVAVGAVLIGAVYLDQLRRARLRQ